MTTPTEHLDKLTIRALKKLRKSCKKKLKTQPNSGFWRSRFREVDNIILVKQGKPLRGAKPVNQPKPKANPLTFENLKKAADIFKNVGVKDPTYLDLGNGNIIKNY